MNCAESKELMVSYIEDLLDRETKQSLAEHLKDCASCRAELKEVSNLRDRLVKNGKVLTRSNLENAVLDRIICEQNIKLTTTTKTSTTQSIWRIIMKSRITKFAAAAAVVVIAVIVWVQFLTGTNAYAQIAEGLRKAQTVVFTLITQDNQGNGETIKTDVAYKEPGHLRTTTVDGYIAIVDFSSGKMISIVPQGGYTIGEIDNTDKNGTGGFLASIEAMKNLPAKANERLEPKEIDGIVCSGYRVTQGDLTMTVWIDVKTDDLVQVEQKYASAPGMDRIIKNIKFDVELEDSLFSLAPPAGFQSFGVELKDNSAIQTEEVFINWLRWWANGNTDETFPPMVAGSEIAKVTMEMAKQGKLRGASWDKVDPNLMFNALLFIGRLPKESNWRYAGNGVKINTPNTPIFWYRPMGVETYRVIYGDLHVEDVAPENLPK
jgi:outer membrane lipoprotein-sorting protein